jgi:hypothetical protein
MVARNEDALAQLRNWFRPAGAAGAAVRPCGRYFARRGRCAIFPKLRAAA